MKLGNWDENKINVNGGGCGHRAPHQGQRGPHPDDVIASLRRRGGGYGLATICSGAAQGEATVVRVS